MQREIIRVMKLPNVIVLLFRHYNIISSNRSPLWFLEAYIYSMLYHMGASGDLEQIVIQEILCSLRKRKKWTPQDIIWETRKWIEWSKDYEICVFFFFSRNELNGPVKYEHLIFPWPYLNFIKLQRENPILIDLANVKVVRSMTDNFLHDP
jgi:hypothetical protein